MSFARKTVLIAGGAGSLGRKLVEEFIKPEYGVEVVRILDQNENGLFNLRLKFGDNQIRYFVGNIRNKERITRAMENCDFFINCAALKDIFFNEMNPFEAIESNVIGVQNCIEAALENNIERFIQISSDKCVQSTSTYGRCKALSESLTLDANNYKGDRQTIFSVIRPPNYLSSDGSVMDVWNFQRENNLPLTLTSPQATRYFMKFPDIVAFIIKCIGLMQGGEVFIPSEGVEEVKLIDLAKKLSNNIKIVGLRKGEKLRELLMDPSEEERAEMIDGIWVIH